MGNAGPMGTMEPKDLDFAETAPVIAERAAVISGTPAQVWAAILDYPGWADWFPGVKRCRSTSDPATGVGSTRSVGLGAKVVVDERFIGWEEPTLWAFTALSGPPGFASLVERVRLREVDGARTEVTYRMAIGPRPALVPLFKALRPVIEKNLAKALSNLDGVVARGSATS
jgi:carbon monoxide dehydrogenase subunit G